MNVFIFSNVKNLSNKRREYKIKKNIFIFIPKDFQKRNSI